MRSRRFVSYWNQAMGSHAFLPSDLGCGKGLEGLGPLLPALRKKNRGRVRPRPDATNAVLCLARFEYNLTLLLFFPHARFRRSLGPHRSSFDPAVCGSYIERQTLRCQTIRDSLTYELCFREDRMITGEHPICRMYPATHLPKIAFSSHLSSMIFF